jgi:rod shape-determining protein MreD
MQYTIAAALAVVAALVEFTVVPYIKVGNAVPHPILVFGVIWTIASGLEAGLVWAFVGGLTLDILTQRPLGSSSFALLIALGVASIVGSLFGRVRIAAPIVATAIASVIYTMLVLAAVSALSPATLSSASTDGVVGSMAYDTILAVVFGPLVLAVTLRRRDAEWVDR